MVKSKRKKTSVSGAGIGARSRKKGVGGLSGQVTDGDAEVRTKAWLGAGEVGAAAVGALAEVMTDKDLEVARAAKRALWKIVRHTGRPGADKEKNAVAGKLVDVGHAG